MYRKLPEEQPGAVRTPNTRPPISGGEDRVASLYRAQLRDRTYMFILLTWHSMYVTDIADELDKQAGAFASDLDAQGVLVRSLTGKGERTLGEFREKFESTDVIKLLDNTVHPLMLVIEQDFATFDPAVHRWGIIWFSRLEEKPSSIAHVLHRLARLTRSGEDVFDYLDGVRRREKLAPFVKYFKINKVGAFGIFLDVEALLQDAVSPSP